MKKTSFLQTVLMLFISVQVIPASTPAQGYSYWSNLGSRASDALGSFSPQNLSLKQLGGIALT